MHTGTDLVILPTAADGRRPPSRRWWDSTRLEIAGRGIEVVVVSDGEALSGIDFVDRPGRDQPREPGWVRDRSRVADAIEQLQAYAAGDLDQFTMTVRPSGTTFQIAVWEALARIPFGSTTTYGALAREIGRKGAARAVGAAVGANRVAIVLPCHRVIGSDGSLTGFSGGMDHKVALLCHEGVLGT